MWKFEFCQIFGKNFGKKLNKNSRQYFLFLKLKSKTFSWKTLTNFSKIGETLVKNSEKCE